VAKCHDREIYMKDGKNFSHYISHTSVDNDLPRKLQSEFMEKIYGFNRWASKNDLSRTIQFIN